MELNTWAGKQSSCQQQFNEVDEVCRVNASQVPGFPVLAVAASPPSACVRISWFLLHPLLRTNATLKTNKIRGSRAKRLLFLVSQEGNRSREWADRDVPRIPV